MGKRFSIILFLLVGILFFSLMFMSETQKLNVQLKSNYELEGKITESYTILQETNSSLIEKRLELDEKIQYKNNL
ncbi:MAG TPA: hypothetical protein PLI06_10025, partial [Methanofastidiosum sp.]|nr:hypothetical protein [Methanofastidiosum sp.]